MKGDSLPSKKETSLEPEPQVHYHEYIWNESRVFEFGRSVLQNLIKLRRFGLSTSGADEILDAFRRQMQNFNIEDVSLLLDHGVRFYLQDSQPAVYKDPYGKLRDSYDGELVGEVSNELSMQTRVPLKLPTRRRLFKDILDYFIEAKQTYPQIIDVQSSESKGQIPFGYIDVLLDAKSFCQDIREGEPMTEREWVVERLRNKV